MNIYIKQIQFQPPKIMSHLKI